MIPSRSLPIAVYTRESPLRNPLQLLRAMCADLLASTELGWRLFLRDMSAQYRQSILGYVCAIIPPLGASLPFGFLHSQVVVNMCEAKTTYAAYAVNGTSSLQVFVD